MLTQKIKGLIKGCSNVKTGRDPEEKNREKKKKTADMQRLSEITFGNLLFWY